MILELATLDIRAGMNRQFEAAFNEAQAIIARMPGYISHQLRKCIETPDRYLLTVQWETLESHTEGFRHSEEYQQWKNLLHHFYQPFPKVEHYEIIRENSAVDLPG